MDTGVQREKEHQRAAGIARRRALSVQQRTVFDAALPPRVLALPAFAAARTVLSYCAVGGEANPAAIDAAALRLGKAVAYPLCLEEGHMEAALPEAADALAPGRYGIPAPIPGVAVCWRRRMWIWRWCPARLLTPSAAASAWALGITTAIWSVAGLSPWRWPTKRSVCRRRRRRNTMFCCVPWPAKSGLYLRP